MIKYLSILCLLCSCSAVKVVTNDTTGTVCSVITDYSTFYKSMETLRNQSGQSLGLELPDSSPVQLRVKSDIARQAVMLAKLKNNRLQGIEHVVAGIVMLRNSAPCNEENIRGTNKIMGDVVKALSKAYTPSVIESISKGDN